MSDQVQPSWLARTVPALVFGLAAGVVLCAVRAPRGLDLIQTQATSPAVAYGWRAAALGVAALGLALARGPLAIGPLLLGLVVGFGSAGLLVDPWVDVQSSTGLFAWLALGAVALAIVGRRVPAADAPARTGPLRSAGVLLAGFGFALAADALGDWSSLWQAGRPLDASTSTTIFLALAWLGYASFKDLVRSTGLGKSGRIALTGGLALASAGALGGIALLGDVASKPALEAYVGSFGVYPTSHPNWDFQGLLAARGWALAGLIAGIALAGARGRRDLALVAAGAAVAHAALPGLRPLFFERAGDAGPAAAACAATGTVVALGGLAAVAFDARARGAGRLWAVALGLAALAAVLFVPRPPATPLSPWGLAEPDQELGLARSVGYLSVESARGFSEVLTVDRRRVSPIFEEEEADRVRMELSVALLAPDVVERGARVLFVGALTPARVRALSAVGVTELDRTAPWYDELAAIEAELFDDNPPPGELVPPGDALDRVEAGDWDLVISPPSFGGRTVVPPLAPGPGTVVVCWVLAEHQASDLDWGDEVLVATDGVLDLGIGIVAGDWDPARAGSPNPDLFRARDARVALYPAGSPIRRAPGVSRLHLTPFQRAHDPVVRTVERLASGARTERQEHLTRGLVEHQAVQLPDPNWADRVTGPEIDFDALAELRDAALGELPDATTAYLWEGLARMLILKRDIQAIFDFVAPIAADRPFWPRLQEVLAHADREFLEPEAAAARFERLVELQPFDLEMRLVLAETLEQAGRPDDAARQYARCLEIQPGRHDIERRLAMAWVRAGNVRGPALVEELLAEDPDDEELASFLGPGPYPPVAPTFRPHGHLHSFRKGEAGHDGDEHDGHEH